MLEGLSEHGEGIVRNLQDWHESGIANLPLHNWLYFKYGTQPEPFRPERMREPVDATFRDIIERLRLRNGGDGDE